MTTPITKHARARMQQRGISMQTLDVLLDYGREAHDHRGCVVVWFDKRARRRAAKALGPEDFRRIEGRLGTYAVLGGDDAVVTVGHRRRHIAA